MIIFEVAMRNLATQSVLHFRKGHDDASVCCVGKYLNSNLSLDRGDLYREAPGRQSRTVLCLVGCSVIDCRDLCH